MGTIILVRHGENDWSKKNKLAGRIPGVHLNEAGHQQAYAAAQRLVALPIKAVYSSPVIRCLETAAYIADVHRLSILEMEDLAEVEYGEWEGKKIKKLARKPLWRAVQFFPSRVRFPQGEALRDVQHRAVQAIEAIATQHEKEMVVIVSHADLIRLVLAHYLGIHIDLFQRLVVSPASASVLSLNADGMVRVLRVNDDGPLHAKSEDDQKEKEKPEKRNKMRGGKKTEANMMVEPLNADDSATADSSTSQDSGLPAGTVAPIPPDEEE